VNAPCEFLNWDSAFFNYRVGRVTCDTLAEPAVEAILRWSADNRIDCLYFLARANDDETVRLAEANGFHLVDIRVTLTARASASASRSDHANGVTIRPHVHEDISVLRAIAATGYGDSRFYYDGHFPRERCNEMYAVWVEKACNDPEQRVLVATVEDRIAGFITCAMLSPDRGRIGLLGVAESFRGQRIGPCLIDSALDYFRSRNVEQVTVVTQGRNIAAQRSYQRAGFVTETIQLWYHKWFLP